MSPQERWLLAISVFLADVVAVFVPLVALFAASVIIARPPWFRHWVGKLYGDTTPAGD